MNISFAENKLNLVVIWKYLSNLLIVDLPLRVNSFHASDKRFSFSQQNM